MKARALVLVTSLAAMAVTIGRALSVGIDTRVAGPVVAAGARESAITVVLLTGGGLALLVTELVSASRANVWLGQIVAVVGVAGAAIVLTGHSVPAMPSLFEALALAFLGAGIALAGSGRRRSTTTGHALALVAMAVGTFVLIAFFYSADPLRCRTGVYGMSPVLALAVVLLGFATLATNPDVTFVRVFYPSSDTGRLARRFMPNVFMAALLVAVGGAAGLRAGWFDERTGMTLLAFLFLLVLGSVTWRYALAVHGAEARLAHTVHRRTRRLSETITEIEEFSQALAHDVRGPMINLREFLTIVLSEHAGDLSAEAREYLERAGRASQRVDSLTSAMLRYGEVSRRKFRLQSVDPVPLVQRVADEVRQRLGIDATIEVDGTLLPVRADEWGLAEILREVLDNACRFSRPGTTPRIRISCQERPRAIRLLVKDEGIGVRAEFQLRIFRPFEQLVRSQDHPGIGLALAKRAVTKMNGRIGVISDGVNGSTFWIELPRADKGRGALHRS